MQTAESAPNGEHAVIRVTRLLRSSPAWLIDVVALSTLAAFLAVVFLSRESMWLDEAFSVKLAEADWATLWAWLSESEANGSLYYALLHVWLELGQSELVVRGLSVVGAVATIPLF